MPHDWFLDRRRLLRSVAVAGAVVALRPSRASSQPHPVLTRPIPSSGEALPLVGLGSWITFNVGNDPLARDACTEVMRAFFQAGGRLIGSSPMYGSSQKAIGYTINWAARYFAIGFAVEALLLAWIGIMRDRLRFPSRPDGAGRAGLCILLLALAAYPLIGRLVGRPWMQMEIFGAAPDPTAVATLGVLVAAQRAHWGLLVVPLLWCAIGGATLWTMQAPDALIMPAAAVAAIVLAGWKSRRRARQASPDGT